MLVQDVKIVKYDVQRRNAAKKAAKVYRTEGAKRKPPSFELWGELCYISKTLGVLKDLFGYYSIEKENFDKAFKKLEYRKVWLAASSGKKQPPLKVEAVWKWSDRGDHYTSPNQGDLHGCFKNVAGEMLLGVDNKVYQQRIPMQYGRQFGATFWVELIED